MKTQELVEDDNTTRMDYQVTGGNSTENSTAQVLHIIRKLDTGDPQDVNITVSFLTVCSVYTGYVYLSLYAYYLPGPILLYKDLCFYAILKYHAIFII